MTASLSLTEPHSDRLALPTRDVVKDVGGLVDVFGSEALRSTTDVRPEDTQLAAVVRLVVERMAGPLARSPLAISKAVAAWRRTRAAG